MNVHHETPAHLRHNSCSPAQTCRTLNHSTVRTGSQIPCSGNYKYPAKAQWKRAVTEDPIAKPDSNEWQRLQASRNRGATTKASVYKCANRVRTHIESPQPQGWHPAFRCRPSRVRRSHPRDSNRLVGSGVGAAWPPAPAVAACQGRASDSA